MILERTTHKVKVGRVPEFVELHKRWLEHNGVTGRICSNNNAWGIVTVDIEFDSYEDWLKFWTGYDGNSPENKEFWKKLNELRESGTTQEIWRVW